MCVKYLIVADVEDDISKDFIKDTVVNGQQYYYIYILYFNILGVWMREMIKP